MSPLVSLFLLRCWTEKKRHIFRNLFNTFVPIVFIIAIVKAPHHQQTKYENGAMESAIDQDDLVDTFPGEIINKVYYTPRTNLTEALMEDARQTLNAVDERVIPFNSETELEYELLDNEHICFGIIFHNVSDDGLLRYTIRTKNNNFQSETTYSRDVFYVYKKRDNKYVESGYLALQNAVDRAFLSHVAKAMSNEEQKLQRVTLRYGHVPVDESRGPDEPSSSYHVPAWLVACFTFASVYLLLLPIVEERACGMGEHLKIACLDSYWNEVTIFLITFAQLCAVFLVCVSISLATGVWETNLAQIIYLILFGMFFLVNLIAFIFFLSTTLESSTVATAVAPVCLYVPLLLGQLSKTITLPLCIFPVTGFLTGGSILASYKASGHRFGAYDLFNPAYPSLDGVSLFLVCLMQILGILLWTFLWFYVTNVFPGRYGTPKSKFFLCSRNYWRGVQGALARGNGMRHINKIMAESQRELQQQDSNVHELDNTADSISMEMAVVEKTEESAIGKHMQPLVRISNLNKVFKGRWSRARTKVAVKNFSISIYSHNITVLLGHNGAGKTTTMNIITGMLPRTSGTILVDGEHDPNRYRQRIGFCPQHNVFYSYLNCREHLEFFGRLRGLNATEARRETQVVLEKVNLVDKSEHFVHTLSGGMKRRLSLANAIIGHTKLLILDEPTSGLDPESRRDIWDLLLKLRKDHTILLTTHFMEEADILGDWIAIMEYGELVAFGTPMFLKQVYGKGYTLRLQKSPDFDERRTLELVRQHVPDAVVRESVQEVFAVTLPYDALNEYPSLLKKMETDHRDLGVEAISISNASLEEVFLNSSKLNKVVQHHQESEERVDSPLRVPPSLTNVVKRSSNLSWQASLNICLAIWRKKLIHIKCNKHIYGSLLSLPVIVTLLCFWVTTEHTDVRLTRSLDSFDIQRALGVIAINHSPNNEGVYPHLLSKESILSDANPLHGGMQLLVLENVSLANTLMKLIEKDYTEYRDRVVVGIECNTSMDNVEITVLHNNNLVHSTGIGESVVATLLLRYYFGLPGAMVEVQNIRSTRKLLIDIGTPYFFTELVSIAFMFYILIFMLVPLQEYQTGFHQLQNINRYMYWSCTFLFDFLIHFLISVLVIIVAMNMDQKDAFSSSVYMQILVILLLYGMLALMVVYIISQCVENSNTAITIMSYLMIVGVGGVFLLSNGYDDIQNNCFWIGILHLVPEFGFKHSMRIIFENQKLIVYENHSKGHVGHRKEQLSLSKFYAAAVIIFLLLELILHEVVENIYRRERISNVHTSIRRYIRRLCSPVCSSMRRKETDLGGMDLELGKTSAQGTDEIDGGGMHYVQEESEMVDKLLDGNSTHDERKKYAIVVKQLHKAYCAHDAVKCISFAVKKGECFGLLGMNGAGKTTVFQMLSRNLPISAGEIYLQHCEVQKTNALEYRQQYGYCPQVDMLLDFMTVYETIDYFAQLKSIPSRESHIIYWLTVLDILAYKDHELSECSGGTKRKVNTILALLGGPSVVLLDEPTTGVDPKSRRFLWKCIKAIQREDQAILLTSHSMNECEELCNRLSIMVDGRLRCIGSILQLKKRHGQGYNLLLKLNSTSVARSSLISDVEDRFRASLQEEHKDVLKFTVNPALRLSELFEHLIELKCERKEEILSCSINETSLEDIFLQFRLKTRNY